MKSVDLTCIVCPTGCSLHVELEEDGSVRSVSGNTCKRGEAYARDEVLHPTRTLTTTVRANDGRLVAVKTDRPIPKESLFAAMQQVNKLTVHAPIAIGDVLLAGLFGANLVATAALEESV